MDLLVKQVESSYHQTNLNQMNYDFDIHVFNKIYVYVDVI